MKELSNKSPKSAMDLYVKIYCQKQDKTRDRQYALIEATKSWVSLSKTDKKYFLNVYKEYMDQRKKNFASKLQNAELYMKKKHDPKRLNKTKSTIIDCNKSMNEDLDAIESITSIGIENSYSIPKDNREHNEVEIQHDNEQLEHYNTTSLLETITHVNEEPDVPKLISEPTPPVRSSIELFEIIKHNDESTERLTWADLTNLQKQRYQRALLSIKNDYIKQYTAYLEQLTPEQLFHHYKYKS